ATLEPQLGQGQPRTATKNIDEVLPPLIAIKSDLAQAKADQAAQSHKRLACGHTLRETPHDCPFALRLDSDIGEPLVPFLLIDPQRFLDRLVLPNNPLAGSA